MNRQCDRTRKRTYGTSDSARDAAADISAAFSTPMESYLDPRCGHWHLRSVTKRKMDRHRRHKANRKARHQARVLAALEHLGWPDDRDDPRAPHWNAACLWLQQLDEAAAQERAA